MASLTDVTKLQELSKIVEKGDFDALSGFLSSLRLSGEEQRDILSSLKSLPDLASGLSEISPNLIRMGHDWR